MNRLAIVAAFALAGAAGLAGQSQEPPATPPSTPSSTQPAAASQAQAQTQGPKPASAAEVARAEALLRLHAERSQRAKILVADYVQRRTTELLKEPLVSKGRFLFRRESGVVVFFAAEPRPSVVRLAERVYEVHRPQKKQVERFHLDGPELARSLFAAVGGDSAPLLRDFVVIGVVDVAAAADGKPTGTVQVQLAPRTPSVAARVRSLDLTLQAADGLLREVAYRDHSGDRVAIELNGIELDPKTAPAADLVVEPGTAVLEHRPKPAGS
ncbi:MAG: outer membrane lipoprotein carrier protein LolA [Planctomycetes bacterium]|nr:outer membrane lipoprotein carrier protein LolA [Planctomycetota bacterium]